MDPLIIFTLPAEIDHVRFEDKYSTCYITCKFPEEFPQNERVKKIEEAFFPLGRMNSSKAKDIFKREKALIVGPRFVPSNFGLHLMHACVIL